MENIEDEFSEIAALFGDKARAKMLWNLLDGRAYTATELANCGGVSLQAASNHLSKLLKKRIVSVEKQGRHRYYRFSTPEVAHVVESMASLLSLKDAVNPIKRPKKNSFTYARSCYNHLAGEVGVKITNAMEKKGIILLVKNDYIVTEEGKEWFIKLGINVTELEREKRSFVRKCLDWSERKFHLAGALGDALLEIMLEKDWLRKVKNSRELIITAKGSKEIESLLNVVV